MTRQRWMLVVSAGLASLLAACAPAMPAATEEPYSSRSGVAYTEEAAEQTEAPMGEAAYPAADVAMVQVPENAPQEAAPAGGGQQPDMMFFQDYGTNPFVSAGSDNLSTFAVDVDTASYTLTRSYLSDGILPPPEAVRLEEFVNYFEQDYPLPQENAFGINLDAATVPFTEQGTLVMRVGIQGYDVADDARPDATLVFVVDVSGSMNQENRLGSVKQALNALVKSLRPTDRVGLVVYGERGRVLLEPTEIGQGQVILDAIAQLQPEGSTNAEQGLRLGYEMATANFDPSRINRIILCSDGVANVGNTGPNAILETVRTQAREGITLTTVGFGMGNYNDVLMEQLADDGDGTYHYVDTHDEARRVFVEGLTGTLLTIAKNAKIQVEFNPQTVTAYRLMGYENRAVADNDFRNDQVDAGEIGAGHSVTALYEIVPNAQAQPGDGLATVRVRWEDPETGLVTEIVRELRLGDSMPSFDQASPRFRLDVAAAAFADLLGQGAWMQTATYEQVLDIARRAAAELQQDADAQEFVQLVERAAQLSQ